MAKRKANRNDVLDELYFIFTSPTHYTISQKTYAKKLYDVLAGEVFDADKEILNVIDILNGHYVVKELVKK